MPLIIEVFFGTEDAVFDALLQTVRCDPGLYTQYLNQAQLQVLYNQKLAPTVVNGRIYELVRSVNDIIIMGVDSTFVVPESTQPITKATGGACLPDFAPEIDVYLDVTDGGGDGKYYVVHDTDSQDIFAPRESILYHELAHAYHYSKGDAPADDKANEIQAIADENSFRKEMGLPARHATDHYGTLGVPAHGGVAGLSHCKRPSGKTIFDIFDCIVATAAVGTPHAPQVAALRRAKQEYRSLSLWTAMIAEPALKLYGRFSPGVARDMNSSPALRQAMRLYAVVPVFHLVNAAETYLAADSDSPEVVKKLGRLFNEYLDDVKRARSSASELSQAAEGALVASRMLTGAFPERGLASDTMPRSLFPSLATAIRSTGGSTTAFAWALTGIGLFLTEAAATLEGRANTAAFLRLLGAWVARMPIPPEDQLRISDVRRELGVLADRIFRRPDLRGLFAQHLVAHWPATSAPTLAALLRDAGFGDASGEH